MAQVLAVVASSPVVTPLVDIAIPVYNEERDLERSVRRLRRYLDNQFPFEARITVVDDLPIVGAALPALDQLAAADGAAPGLRETLVADRFSRNGAVH